MDEADRRGPQELGISGDGLEEEDDEASSGFVLGLVGTRGTTVYVDKGVSDDSSDGEQEEVEEGAGTADKRAVKPTEAACSQKASDTRRHTTFESRMLQYVRSWKELNDPLW